MESIFDNGGDNRRGNLRLIFKSSRRQNFDETHFRHACNRTLTADIFARDFIDNFALRRDFHNRRKSFQTEIKKTPKDF